MASVRALKRCQLLLRKWKTAALGRYASPNRISIHADDYENALWATVSGLGDRYTTCVMAGGIVVLSSGKTSISGQWLEARESLQLNGKGVRARLFRFSLRLHNSRLFRLHQGV